ncbi:MAG: iron export ABC transporter permease subunit FetB [Desulfarculaceae bacterium]|nr:iron export ABC transporter permease subunit FetB [Desulfarculaceae bacterium]MCF8048990.1 iron export ABC transporter permease subunit FetB [Desulfarculaceae bacterium]MCF8065502.1 iron export ABC transporter permease subunit FetB [Desulfarculaceae bacterium]MCF8124442.1 iron export ABC transporter permease subunit FetB [Desulfarculaceae bacterium]
MSGAVDIGYGQLALALGFVLLAGGASLWLKLGLGRDLLVGTLRTVAQLALMGYVLLYIFAINLPWLVLLLFAGMIFFAARIVAGRVKGRGVPVFWPVFLSMLLSYMVVSFLVTGVVVQADPWWNPRYFLPLGGMVVGNSMNAMALSLERLFGEVKNRREEVELLLSLGAEPGEATAGISADAIRAGMIPSINSMMGVGLVFIPGMMTGQILAGADPLLAIKYQIVVMLMLVGSTTLGSVLAVSLARRRLFTPAQQLRPGVPGTP